MVLFCLFFFSFLLITLKPVLEGCNSLPPAYNIDIETSFLFFLFFRDLFICLSLYCTYSTGYYY